MRKKSKCYFLSSGVNLALERIVRCDGTLLRDEFAILVMTKLGNSPCRPQSKKAKTGKQSKIGASGKK